MTANPPGGQETLGQRSILFVRSALFVSVQWLSVLVFGPLVFLSIPFPFPARFRFVRQWARFNLWWLRVSCGLDYRVEGREHLPDEPCIVMSKHESAWETLALQMLFSPLVWVLKRELLWIPLFGWGLALLKSIAIDRGSGRQAIKQIVSQGRDRLNEGIWVVIFPEGTRVAPGTRGQYRPGGAILAAQTGYPVLPLAHDAGDYWPRRSFLKRPGTIRVVLGPVIPARGRGAGEVLRDTERWIEGTMSQVLRPGRANPPVGSTTD